MKVRLMGLEEECREAVAALQAVLNVVEIDGPHLNRGNSKLVRFYVETRDLKFPVEAPQRLRPHPVARGLPPPHRQDKTKPRSNTGCPHPDRKQAE